MLKKIRVAVAAIVFLLVTLLFLDFTGTLHKWFGWLAKIQLVPAILAHSLVIIGAILLFTLLFGRVYCSVVCPLGVMQDGISNVSGRRKGHKNRFRYSGAVSWLRWGVLAVSAVCLVAGVGAVVSLLDPYAAFGRIMSSFFAPLYGWGNNLMAWFAERADSYAFYSTDVFVKSWIVLGVAAVTLIAVAVLAWRNGRTYCNTICPVGTLLGFVSRFSIFRPAFDGEKCTKCGACEKGCKASCIDSKNLTIDQSRCVTCFNCIDKCKFGAMEYRPHRFGAKKETASAPIRDVRVSPSIGTTSSAVGVPTVSRRKFISIAALFAFTNTIKAQQLQVDGGLADIEDKKRPDRKTPVTPPGAEGAAHLKQHCSACQLCVSACPNHIMLPSSKLATLMQPELTYERGYCRPECTECSQVCPSGAIKKITPADKAGISIGQAYWIKENCIVNTDQRTCTACQRHCPTGAITLVARDPDDRRSLKIPTVDNALCIGCGACEYVCPARPFSAIYVEGNVKHHTV